MNEKTQILQMLKDEYNHWDDLISGLSEEQITAPQLPSNLSIKDVIAHLWAWQQRSIARMEAGLHNRKPNFPDWPEGLDPDSEEDLEPINAWIHDTNHGKPWLRVIEDWRSGFQRFLELGEAVPEKDLLEPGRYAWLGENSLSLILISSYNHHHEEHLQPLLGWLRQNG